MPQETQLAHRVLTNLALPYVTNVSPANTDPHYTSGATDILTSINTYAERRPGFADNVEAVPVIFNNLQRLFTWDRFDGTFLVMACDINASGFAQVFKFIAGVDAGFVSIYTDTGSIPFDFVVSNNTVYFSNTISAKKYDPVNGVSNWGIAIGSVNNALGPNRTANGTQSALPGFINWTNPNNVTSAVSFATVALSSGTNINSQSISCTQFAFAIPATETITGIQVTAEIRQTNASNPLPFLSASLLKAGTIVGANKTLPNIAPIVSTFTFGSTSDLWGATWTPNDINQSTFGVSLAVEDLGGQVSTFSLRNVQITIFGLGGPTIAVSGAAGSLTATAGYTYVFCYGNSATGHISSPTPASASTGVFTNKANVAVTLTGSTDPQVNQIRLFRTTDGGGGTYLELPTSPYPNSSGVVTDNAPDKTLQIGSVAPTPTFNDPPTPFQGMVYFSGRIWGFIGNKVWFSGLEEINQGVPEECFPSGIAGNFWAFDEPVQGIGTAGVGTGNVLLVLSGGRIYGIAGNTLATFQRFLISNRRGARNLTCVVTLGGMCAWLDSANQVWATDGNTSQELSTAIRNDLVGIVQANCSMTFHSSGRFHWLVLSTGVRQTSGTNAPTVAVDTPSLGLVPWSNPNNIFVADGIFATASGVTFGQTHFLDATGFNFPTIRLPIVGVQVQIKGFQTSVAIGNTVQVELLNNGNVISLNKSGQLPLANGFISIGGQADNWNAGLTYSDVTSPTFGVRIWGFESVGAVMDFNIDVVQVTVFYGSTYVYDVDQDQWMPPWSIAPQYIYSGEISPGNYVLMASNGSRALQLNPNKFNDNGATYAPVAKTGLLSVIPDYGSRFSYIGVGSYNEPTRTGYPSTFQLTNNGRVIPKFEICADEDTTVASYSDITANLVDTAVAYNRTNGSSLKQLVYQTTAPASRWIGIKATLAKLDQVDNLYELFMAYKGLGGR